MTGPAEARPAPGETGRPPAPPGQRPLLLVISAGGQAYREYLLRSIGARYRVHLFLGALSYWE